MQMTKQYIAGPCNINWKLKMRQDNYQNKAKLSWFEHFHNALNSMLMINQILNQKKKKLGEHMVQFHVMNYLSILLHPCHWFQWALASAFWWDFAFDWK